MILGTSYTPECLEWFRKRHEARAAAETTEELGKVGTPTMVTDEVLAQENAAHDAWMQLAKQGAQDVHDWIGRERAKLASDNPETPPGEELSCPTRT